jgi:beta-glucosidase
MTIHRFPKGFLWGASTSSYQIEGALDVDGRGKSVWDSFAERGRICDGTTAAVACDHYRRYPEDVALMKAAGFNAYRFSIAWPRILPEGRGRVETRGLDFYDRLVDEILEAGIRPMACLFHWDLPQTLEDEGGWMSREIVGPFSEYARICAERLSDRVADWMTLNEQNVVACLGYAGDGHAPGRNLGFEAMLKAMHHMNLAQASAMRVLRAERADLTIGTVCNFSPVRPETDSPADRAAAKRWSDVWNGVTLDGLYKGRIPDAVSEIMKPFVLPGDEEAIRFPPDLLGINYYSASTIKDDSGNPEAWVGTGGGDAKVERFTGMGWPVQPEGLRELLNWLRTEYDDPAVYIAENGAAYDDVVDEDGQVRDADRVAFIKDHVVEVAKAIEDGCDVKGYLAWSLLDNFEWGFGLSKRFGIVRVDYDTQRRTPKDSYRLMARLAADNAVDDGK